MKAPAPRSTGGGTPPAKVPSDVPAKAKGKVRVMTQGVFDLLHVGHLHYFEAAKRLGDELVVVIARDETVAKRKHSPVFPEEVRRQMVEALKPVDHAVLGHVGDWFISVEELRPDLIAIGYDQPYREEEIERVAADRGVKLKVVRLPHMDSDLDGTRKVIEKIAARATGTDLYAAEKGGKSGLETGGSP